MSKPKIRILSNLARVGGTLVNKCLGSMDNLVVLSEIHPLGTEMFNPLLQAQEWYNLFQPNELSSQLSFLQAIQKIDKRCAENNDSLIIRDWAHLDYIGVPFLKNPNYRLRLNEQLSPSFEILQFSIVRHPVSQWISTSNLQVMQGCLKFEEYLVGYRHYAEMAAAGEFVRFEDFTREPFMQIQRLCKYLDVEFDPKFIDQWYMNSNVSGDTSVTSWGTRATEIKPSQPISVEPSLMKKFLDNDDYNHAIELLGYNHL